MPVNPDIFHAHLDACSWCRDHPHALCEKGVVAIHQACDVPVPAHTGHASQDMDAMLKDLMKIIMES